MKITSQRRGLEWFEHFPAETRSRVEYSSNGLLVDIGGNLGHDLIAFKQKHPAIPCKIILQDPPSVIDNVKDLPPGIEAVTHDVFASQPFKSTKAYYLRSVLHD